MTSQKLNSLLGQGGEIKVTALSESFGLDEFQTLYGSSPVLLMAIDPQQCLHPFTEDNGLKIGAGWTLIALISKDALKDAENTKEQALAADEHTVV